MAFSTKFINLKNVIKRRPLLFNSIIYGSFYTGAEFAQQSYNLRYQSKKQDTSDSKTERFVALGSSSSSYKEIQRSNDINTNEISYDYDWQQLQRYAVIGCFVTGPILHGWLLLFFYPCNRARQRAKSERSPYDWTIMARYAFLGTLVYSPIYYHWYKWLDRIFRGTTMRVIMVKLFTDQFVLTPPLLALFFISMSCLEGRTDIIHECRMKFVKTFQTSCLYWIPVQFVNFLLIPPALRVLYVSVAAFCWVNILCYLKRLPVPSKNTPVDN